MLLGFSGKIKKGSKSKIPLGNGTSMSPRTKFLLKVLSAVAFLAAITWLSGSIWTALGFMISIGWHENAHLWAARRTGIETGGFVFIPFMGGIASINESPKSRADECFIAVMGPTAGFVLSLVFFVLHFIPGLGGLLNWAFYGALINLFNLLPISPMDGGRILKSLAFSLNDKAGLATMVFGIIFASFGLTLLNPVIGLFIAVIGIQELHSEVLRYRTRSEESRAKLAEEMKVSVRKQFFKEAKKVLKERLKGQGNTFSKQNMQELVEAHTPGLELALGQIDFTKDAPPQIPRVNFYQALNYSLLVISLILGLSFLFVSGFSSVKSKESLSSEYRESSFQKDIENDKLKSS